MQNIVNSYSYFVFGAKLQISKNYRIELHFKTISKLTSCGKGENKTISVSSTPLPTPQSTTN